MCWFEHGITKSHGPPDARAPASASCRARTRCTTTASPSAGPAYLEAVASGALRRGYGVDDGVGLLFRGTRLAEAVASHAGPRAYRVTAADGVACEHELEPRVLARGAHDLPGAVPHDIGELRLLQAARARDARPLDG